MRDVRRSTRAAAVVRTVLLGYGTAALSVLLARSGLPQATLPVGLVAVGIGLQLVLVVARARIGSPADASSATQTVAVLEILGDGITVLLFALATLGAVTGAAAAV